MNNLQSGMGPITDTTRGVYQQKLAKLMRQNTQLSPNRRLKSDPLQSGVSVKFISMRFSGHGICSTLSRLVDGGFNVNFVLYKAWVLKNGSLGPAVSVKFISKIYIVAMAFPAH